MKKLNFKILSVFLAIAIVVSGAAVVVASPREEVNALSPNYDGQRRLLFLRFISHSDL